MKPTLLVVWWSATGGTAQWVEAFCQGARMTHAVHVQSLRAPEAEVSAVLAAQAYVFACPENLGSCAGMMKNFFDRCYYPALDQIAGRPYATMICAGTDGEGAARQITRIATGWRLKAIAEPVIVKTGAQTPQAIAAPKTLDAATLLQASEFGAGVAEGLALGVW